LPRRDIIDVAEVTSRPPIICPELALSDC